MSKALGASGRGVSSRRSKCSEGYRRKLPKRKYFFFNALTRQKGAPRNLQHILYEFQRTPQTRFSYCVLAADKKAAEARRTQKQSPASDDIVAHSTAERTAGSARCLEPLHSFFKIQTHS